MPTYSTVPPPSAFPPQYPVELGRFKIVHYTSADINQSGVPLHSLYQNPSYDHLIHPYVGPGATYNQALADQLVLEITTELAQRNMYKGTGEAGASLEYGGSVFFHNITGGNASQYLVNNAADLMSAWGGGGIDQTFYSLYHATGRTNNANFSDLVAAKLLQQCDALGLQYPLRYWDNNEGSPNMNGAGMAPYDVSLKFLLGGDRAGWWPVANADSRKNTEPIVDVLDSSGAVTGTLTLAQYMAAEPPPSYDVNQYWSHPSNRDFIMWIASLTHAVASASLRRGPEKGFRQRFPLMQATNTVMACGGSPNDLASCFDAGQGAFSSLNDYSWVRFPNCRLAHEWNMMAFHGFSNYNRDKSQNESEADYWIRKCVEQYRRMQQNFYRSVPAAFEIDGLVVTSFNGTNFTGTSPFQVTKAVFLELCRRLIDEGCMAIKIFDARQPIPAAELTLLDEACTELNSYAQNRWGSQSARRSVHLKRMRQLFSRRSVTAMLHDDPYGEDL